jgi:hypothetical protein
MSCCRPVLLLFASTGLIAKNGILVVNGGLVTLYVVPAVCS